MSENRDFDSIMREITGGFTGDPSVDVKYLRQKCEEYKTTRWLRKSSGLAAA